MPNDINETNTTNDTQIQNSATADVSYKEPDETRSQPLPAADRSQTRDNVFVVFLRRLFSGILVSLCLMALMLSMATYWIKNNLATTEVWTDKASRLIENSSIRSSVSTSLSDQIFAQATAEATASGLAPPASLPDGSTKESIKRRIDNILQSEKFNKLWTDINRSAHQGLTNSLVNNGEADQMTKDTKVMYIENSQLIFASRAVLTDIRPILMDGGFDIASNIDISKVPEKSPMMTIGSLSTVMTFVDLFDKAVIFLPILFLTFLIGSLAVSPNKRRTLLKISWSIVLFVAPLAFLPEIVSYLSSTGVNAVDPSILQAFASIFIGEIADTSRTILCIALIVALACYANGTSRLAKYVRTMVGKAIRVHGNDNAVLGWIAKYSTYIIVGIASLSMLLMVTRLGEGISFYTVITSIAALLTFIVSTITQGALASDIVK